MNFIPVVSPRLIGIAGYLDLSKWGPGGQKCAGSSTNNMYLCTYDGEKAGRDSTRLVEDYVVNIRRRGDRLGRFAEFAHLLTRTIYSI